MVNAPDSTWHFPIRTARHASPAASPGRAAPGPPPQAVLFDVGMTLVHPAGDKLLGAIRTEAPAFEAGPEDVVAAMALAAEARHVPLFQGRDQVAKMTSVWAGLLGLPPVTAARAWERAHRRPGLYCELDPGAVPVLRALYRAGITVGAVSNSRGELDHELRYFSLRSYFHAIVDSAECGVEKPEPEIFDAACTAMGVDPTHCWFVGDGVVNDVLGARAAGFAAGILYDRYGVHGHLTSVPRLSRLDDLLEWIS